MHACSGDCALRRARRDAGEPADPSRRAFVSTAVLASVGAFLAACGDGNIGGVTGTGGNGGNNPPPPPGGSLVVTLSNFPALNNVGGIARVDGGGFTPIAVTRVAVDTYVALSMICPHAGFSPIEIIAGVGFECPNHGAQFAPDGNWTGGQGTRDLRQYNVVFDGGAGTLTIS